MFRRISALFAVALTIALFPTASADAADVECGSVVKTDVTLQHDLLNCEDNGLIVGASGITINLNGHVIDSNGAEVTHCRKFFCGVGIGNRKHNDVVVENGTIRDFTVNIVNYKADATTFNGLRLTSARFGGLFDISTSGTTLSDSVVHRNGFHTHLYGLVLLTVDHEVVVNNEISVNGNIGIYVNEGFSHSLIANNTVADNAQAGMILAGKHDVIRDNQLVDNGDGIVFKGRANRVSGNEINASGGGPGRGDGISFEGGMGNVIADNHINHPMSVGINFGGNGGNTMVGNVVVGAGDDGFNIATDKPEPLDPSIIKNNKAIRSGDDGFDVGMVSATLTGNIAVHNGDLGIEAVAGVTDGGGNHAAANGDPRQCTNVAC